MIAAGLRKFKVQTQTFFMDKPWLFNKKIYFVLIKICLFHFNQHRNHTHFNLGRLKITKISLYQRTVHLAAMLKPIVIDWTVTSQGESAGPVLHSSHSQ